jgi:hypothetical protein
MPKVKKKSQSGRKKGVKVKKSANRAVKNMAPKKASKQQKDEPFIAAFEEVTVKCPSCGREFRMVKSAGFDAAGMLCHRCSAGGGMDFDDDDS